MSMLMRPGFKPVRVILPDNAWELGYSSFSAGRGYSVCSVARRQKVEDGQKKRYLTSLPPKATGWEKSFSGTRREGSVDCIAEFPDLIKSKLVGDSIKISGSKLSTLTIWKGSPSYQTFHKEFRIQKDTAIKVKDIFGYYEGKIVLQMIDNKRLKDENILELKGGKPWLISKVVRTSRAAQAVPDMTRVPGKPFSYTVSPDDDFIP